MYNKRLATKRLQMVLPLTFEQICPSKPHPKGPPKGWDRQPAKFPHEWWRLADGNPNWRADYQDRWVESRIAAGLPFEIKNAAVRVQVKKPVASWRPNLDMTSCVETKPGDAVLGKLCNLGQMTA